MSRFTHAEFAAEKATIVKAIQEAQADLRRRQALTDEEQRASTIPPPAPTLPAPAPLKVCGCGRDYAADEWERLTPPPGGGVMDLGDGAVLSLRNCPPPCFSTLALEVPT